MPWTRRAMVALAFVSSARGATSRASARAAPSTWTLRDLPSRYERIHDVDRENETSSRALFRDKTFGYNGNVVVVTTTTATSGGPRALADVGDVEEVARRLCAKENAKRNGEAKCEVISFASTTSNGEERYVIELSKDAGGARRRSVLALALSVDGESSTLVVMDIETDERTFANENVARELRGVTLAIE